MKVLIIEDSDRLRRALREGLVRERFTVDLAADGQEGWAYARTNHYDVIVLDLMLPKIEGLTILKRLRELGDITPVLIISAKDQVPDRVQGLEIGADDYLVKPFSFDELCARIKALTRRRLNSKSPRITIGPLTIDISMRQANVRTELVPLTPAEYGLLEYLAMRRGQVLSKSQLSDWLHDSEAVTDSNVIVALMSTLRRKIREATGVEFIKTRRGYGYIIE